LLIIVLILARTANAQFFMPNISAPMRSLENYTPTFSAKPGELSQWDLISSRCKNAAFLAGGVSLYVPILAPLTGPLATLASVCATSTSAVGTAHRFVNHMIQPGYEMGTLNAIERVGSQVSGPIMKKMGALNLAQSASATILKKVKKTISQ